MNDKELADAVVALGVGQRIDLEDPHSGTAWVLTEDCGTAWLTGESFVRDWRVAGALMEKCTDLHYDTISTWNSKPSLTTIIAWANGGVDSSEEVEVNESLPRAIIEACVEAATKQGDPK